MQKFSASQPPNRVSTNRSKEELDEASNPNHSKARSEVPKKTNQKFKKSVNVLLSLSKMKRPAFTEIKDVVSLQIY